MKHEPLNPGEKYLEIRLLGHEIIYAFRNKDYKSEDDPLYVREGLKIFIRTKKENKIVKVENELF